MKNKRRMRISVSFNASEDEENSIEIDVNETGVLVERLMNRLWKN